MLILALETTCDETAAAVIDGDLNIRSSVVASQAQLHERFRGVVPEIAARAHVERILPVIHETMQQAEIGFEALDAVAVANEPGLSGSLLIGLTAAKTICLVHDIPLIAVNHLHAHVFACQLGTESSIYPCVGLVVSGGHTHLYHYEDALSPKLLGGTIDDAAGEAFDKVASMLGLTYPGGPAISEEAEAGDPEAYAFPRSFLNDDRLDFSFSGLKTAVRYAITGPGKGDPDSVDLSPQQVADLAASFQAAVVDALVRKTIQAVRQTGSKRLCIGGGVAANGLLRQEMKSVCERNGVELSIAAMKHCTDNAMMGAIAVERFNAGLFEDLSLDIHPGLVRATRR